MTLDREDVAWQRLDKWLVNARIVRTRSVAAKLIDEGGVRINRLPTAKPHAKLHRGDVLTLTLQDTVRVIEVRGIAERRGPALAATLLFADVPAPECALRDRQGEGISRSS